jgi:molybdopterin molybdotransferase
MARTGAVVPHGADCVVPVERIAVDNGFATVEQNYPASRHQFIHAQGSDHESGHTVLNPGIALSPMDVAIVASCGLPEVCVSRIPAVRVVSTGNELVPAGAEILAHQIRLSNGPAVMAMLAQQGFNDCEHAHLVDDPALLRDRLAKHLDDADVLILSGGVSMGKADFVPQVLADLGVRQVFHRVSQQPGKPLWFGIGDRQQAVFALPGNPVSTLVCCRHYVLPALLTASGRKTGAARHAVLAESVCYEPELTRFLPVKTASRDDGVVLAFPALPNTSGDFTALGGTSGYVELRAEQSEFPANMPVPLHLWDYP